MKDRGFTLIELLVVVAIISLLSSVVLASLNTARAKARDTQRVSSLKQLVTALELYRDKNGAYPLCTAAIGVDRWCGNCAPSGVAEFVSALTPVVTDGFIKSVPVDPISNTPCYTFEYYTNNQASGGYTCGGVDIGNFPYVIRFGTESVNNLGLPAFSAQRLTGKEYCFIGS